MSQRPASSRQGSDQSSRINPALASEHFQLDERDIADFILFARKLASNIRFYGDGNHANWQAFFEGDISVSLARLANLPLTGTLNFKRQLAAYFANSQASGPVLREYFTLYLRLPLILLEEIFSCRKQLPPSEPLAQTIDHWWLSVAPSFNRLGQFVTAAELPPASANGSGFNLQAVQLSQAFATSNNAAVALPAFILSGLNNLSWQQTLENITGSSSASNNGSSFDAPFAGAGQLADQIGFALRYSPLVNTFEHCISATQAIIDVAEKALSNSLQQANHEPAYGLWLCFIQLFKHAQMELNQFTEKHLDYYYQRILQLKQRPAQPDRVALSFELAPHKNEHLLPATTRVVAGKDTLGNNKLYQLQGDFIVNRGKIGALKSFYWHNKKAYSAQQTNSLDGLEEPLSTDAWPAFGPVHEHSLAKIGFALADPRLLLGSGIRTIEVDITLEQARQLRSNGVFTAQLTTEAGWLDVSAELAQSQPSPRQLKLSIRLDRSKPAITAYQEEVHQQGIKTQYPVLQFRLRLETGQLARWMTLSFERLQLAVTVEHSQAFTVSNDSGDLDPNKSFLPFGPQPMQQQALVIGGEEIGSKPIHRLVITPHWQEDFNANDYYRSAPNPTKVEFLTAGEWQTLNRQIHIAFSSLGVQQALNEDFYRMTASSYWAGPSNDFFQPNNSLSLNVRNQVIDAIRISLVNDFGHREYPQMYALAMAERLNPPLTGINTAQGIPKPPFTPTLASLDISYSCEPRDAQQFFQYSSFGNQLMPPSNRHLFPRFSHQGELYIGFVDLKPGQSISLFFDIADGSSNPLKPPTDLHWHVLAGNQWQQMSSADINDGSESLSGAGIVALELPAAANLRHDIMPSGYHWLRIAAANNADAVCNIKNIYTQAAYAHWIDNRNAADVLDEPTAAGTISKFLEPLAAIKSITQPAASVDGKPPESTAQYRLRVSERLRHNNRGSSAWDYEQLVLQAFPDIYRVKCLRHTELCSAPDNRRLIENNLQAGAVLLVPLPRTEALSTLNPRRPYNSIRQLAAIDQFLREKISPFAELTVRNPQIEEVQLKFCVQFNRDIIDSGYYRRLLNDEISQFIMPWSVPGGQTIEFNGKWYKSSLINFIEERPYVDHIKNVLMFHRRDINSRSNTWRSVDHEEITAATALSVLVSAKRHEIRLCSANGGGQ